MGCVSRKLCDDGGHKNVGDCRRECSSHCSSLYLLKRVVAKSKFWLMLMCNKRVIKLGSKVKRWDLLCISVCIMLKHSDWGMEG